MHRISVPTRSEFDIALNVYWGLCVLLCHRTMIGFFKDRVIRSYPALWDTVYAP
jgi:hypothetical protein